MPSPEDRRWRDGVVALLGAQWPRIPAAIETARRWGADWFEVSTPFVHFEGDLATAHVGVVQVHLRVEGRDRCVAGVHAVVTHPAHRGHGHFREVMEAALAWCDARFETAILWTGEPAIYERFGFRRRAESVFHGEIPSVLRDRRRSEQLSVSRPRDLETLRRLLRTRTPISDRSAARDPGWHFLINLALWPEAQGWLHYLPDLDCVVVAREAVQRLSIYDVVAPRVPTLESVLERLAGSARTMELYVMPDRLGASWLVAGDTPADDDILLYRGPPPFPEGPLALSPFIHT